MPFLAGSSSPIYDKSELVEAMPDSLRLRANAGSSMSPLRVREAGDIGTAEAPKGDRQGKSVASTPSRVHRRTAA